MRFVDKWDVTPDPNPHAFTVAVCPQCLQMFVGEGATLVESSAVADEKVMACSHLKVSRICG